MSELAAGSGLAGSGVLIGVAHGSRDPRAAAAISSLMSLVAGRLGDATDVRTAYLGHAAPSLRSVLGAVRGPVTVLPLLLTDAYHSKVDIPRLLPGGVAYGAALGPHPLLLDALERRLADARLADAGDREATSVVLAAAGSSDPAANATIGRLATRWRRAAGWRTVVPAFASTASPTPAQAVAALRRDGARDVVVASYLLAPGFFADRIREQAIQAGATAVAPALCDGDAPEVAALVVERFGTARSARRAAA